MPRVFALFLCLLIAAPAAQAAIHPDEKMKDPALQKRAVVLYEQVRCVVCDGQAIASSATPVAADMRALIRDELRAGKTDREIRDKLRAAYGDGILLKPPFAPGTWSLWLLPFIVFAGGAALMIAQLRRAHKNGGV